MKSNLIIRKLTMLVFIALFSSYFLSCKNVKNKPKAANLSIRIDNATPENLIRNVFRYSLMADTVITEDTSSIHYALFSTSFRKEIKARHLLVTRDDDGKRIVVVDAEIDKVERQNDTSVSVYTSELFNDGLKKHNTFIYRLVKEHNRWFIDDYLLTCFECKGKGSITDINFIPKQTRTCPACHGKGWFSNRYDRPIRRAY